ncbi:hypothetical protein [Mangrovimonas sp. TPBH4]|nr:hypothetical protein [Mangrovimonas sp. TPBH4]
MNKQTLPSPFSIGHIIVKAIVDSISFKSNTTTGRQNHNAR